MKIIELKFKNLNSLYGEWHIDFTKPEYTSSGIFALTGPTGAGKSTILDAVCLALYGKTPRLGAVTAGGNEIMSRRTGECFSEVVFESRGDRYRCSWSQHRARKNPEGRLADARHEISNAETGQIIESKKSLVSSVIESKTGMDYERFTRSILLAQGDFDTFLKADNSQKSRILEQITGTEIYSDISVKVFEKHKEEKEKLKILEAETGAIVLLGNDELEKLKEELKEKIENEQKLSEKIIKTEQILNVLKKMRELEDDIKLFREKSDILDKERADFKTEKIKLEKSLKAAVFDGDSASLKSMRDQLSAYKKDYKTESERLPSADSEYRINLEKLQNSETKIENLKEERKNLTELLIKTRSLDQKIEDKKLLIESIMIESEKITELITDKKNLINSCMIKISEKKEELKTSEEYLKNNQTDEELVTLLTGIQEQLNTASLKNSQIIKKRNSSSKVSENIKLINKRLSESEKILNENRIKNKEAEELLSKSRKALESLLDGKLLREYRAEKESLFKQKNLVDRIISLENERSILEDGKPCPLCGSSDHPYAEGNIPEKDEIEQRIEYLENIITAAENQEDVIKNCEKNKSDASDLLSESEKNISVISLEKKSAEKEFKILSEDLETLEKDASELESILSLKLHKFGISNFSVENTDDILDSLKKRLDNWQKHNNAKNSSEKILNEINSELKNLDSLLSAHSESLSKKEKELKTVSAELDKIMSERKLLFGERDTDKEESLFNSKFSDAENALNISRSLRDDSLFKLNNIKSRIETLDKKINESSPVLEKTETDFIQKIKDAGFENEKHFNDSRLDPSERENLAAKAKSLDDRAAEIKTGIKDREKRHKEETSKVTGNIQLNNVQTEYEAYKQQQKQLIDETAGIRHRLSENEAAGERIKDKQKAIDSQTAECLKWENLNKYIGSANGNKYREFAQGITFEIMVSHANRQLEKMSDRYILLRSSDAPLELNVADNYQAGEIRSVKNLSGGESFIVSLSLALGLSKMAGRKVRVDSLFLDEGFGTLDEDALETALETLSSLQQDGKLIGVISHVNALKERISTQIAVTPLSGGRSILSGPGCMAEQ